MGTSSIYGGPIDKNKLLPADYDDTDNEKQGGFTEEPWKNTKKLMAQYITGSNKNLNGVVRNYIKASGGAQSITQSSRSGMKSTVNLGQIFSNIKQNGLEKTFKDLNLEYENRDINEVLSELVNIISYSSNNKEEIVAKDATIETLSDIYSFIEENDMDISCLESMNEDIFDVIMCKYISSYIWGRMLNDLESRFEQHSSNPSKSIEIECEFKDYIKSTVDVTYNELKININSFNKANITDIINSLYFECYNVLGGLL